MMSHTLCHSRLLMHRKLMRLFLVNNCLRRPPKNHWDVRHHSSQPSMMYSRRMSLKGSSSRKSLATSSRKSSTKSEKNSLVKRIRISRTRKKRKVTKVLVASVVTTCRVRKSQKRISSKEDKNGRTTNRWSRMTKWTNLKGSSRWISNRISSSSSSSSRGLGSNRTSRTSSSKSSGRIKVRKTGKDSSNSSHRDISSTTNAPKTSTPTKKNPQISPRTTSTPPTRTSTHRTKTSSSVNTGSSSPTGTNTSSSNPTTKSSSNTISSRSRRFIQSSRCSSSMRTHDNKKTTTTTSRPCRQILPFLCLISRRKPSGNQPQTASFRLRNQLRYSTRTCNKTATPSTHPTIQTTPTLPTTTTTLRSSSDLNYNTSLKGPKTTSRNDDSKRKKRYFV